MHGGSEHIVTEVACALADLGHQVTVRLPYRFADEIAWRGVRWVSDDHPRLGYDVLFAVDDYEVRDRAPLTVLVACRSDPPRHTEFSEMIFLSPTHARLMGHPSRPVVGGGVDMRRYARRAMRLPRRVIYTSSPDRGGHHAAVIGRDYDFVATYRGAREVDRDDLERIQLTAQALIHPLDPARPSEFFGMAVLEALAAGTPCVLSDADCLPEVWGEVSIVLPRPIRYSRWIATLDDLLHNRTVWGRMSDAGRAYAARYDWRCQARRYMEVAGAG